ncbi:MAG: Uma2 family endonuclease [Chloroflexota bacterium]
MDRDTVSRDVVATEVTWDDYMARYAHDFHEWVGGEVVKMSPIHTKHNQISRYLIMLLDAYLTVKPVGVLENAPFVMKLPTANSSREPDIQIILNDSMTAYTPTGMLDAADIAVEIVSPESRERDYKTKFAEYETGGVKEYWLIDPTANTAQFYRRGEDGKYAAQTLNRGVYVTPLLPDLRVDTSLLWKDTLPNLMQVAVMINTMLAGNANDGE